MAERPRRLDSPIARKLTQELLLHQRQRSGVTADRKPDNGFAADLRIRVRSAPRQGITKRNCVHCRERPEPERGPVADVAIGVFRKPDQSLHRPRVVMTTQAVRDAISNGGVGVRRQREKVDDRIGVVAMSERDCRGRHDPWNGVGQQRHQHGHRLSQLRSVVPTQLAEKVGSQLAPARIG